MDYKKRWYKIRELNEGGQGKVHLALDKNKFRTYNFEPEVNIHTSIGEIIESFSSSGYAKAPGERFHDFRKVLREINRLEDPVNQGALKVLHKPEDATDADKAEARIKKEIEAMSKASHPNLLKILDYDKDSHKWFVSEYHPKGSLEKEQNKKLFTGDFVGSLRAFRPLVEGVSQLHKDGLVHRDIKPKNVFLDSNDNLVLGDFGLIFFTDEQHTRISETFEKVGTRDWMAPWAMRAKINEVTFNSDVFSLGKLLWAMVSSISILDFWYFDRSQFNLEEMFPKALSIKLANPLFKKCIVENPKDCLSDATALLEEIDKIQTMIDRNADLIREDVKRPCKVCGIGKYELKIDRNREATRSFGVDPTGTRLFKIFICNYCRNVQMFFFADEKSYPPWQ